MFFLPASALLMGAVAGGSQHSQRRGNGTRIVRKSYRELSFFSSSFPSLPKIVVAKVPTIRTVARSWQQRRVAIDDIEYTIPKRYFGIGARRRPRTPSIKADRDTTRHFNRNATRHDGPAGRPRPGRRGLRPGQLGQRHHHMLRRQRQGVPEQRQMRRFRRLLRP